MAGNKYIVAVSGGVDSVVLLDILARQKGNQLVVAHFDHGIRSDSHIDAEIAKNQAIKHNLQFEIRREELGPNASEELARDRRYKFLRELADKYDAQIITAHHGDDAIETVAINLLRGTGWRGLAAMDAPDVIRPFVNKTKSELVKYAKRRKLNWREDSTNTDDKYMRNRVRNGISKMNDDVKRQMLALWVTQKSIKELINAELKTLVGSGPAYSRYFFTNINEAAAIECLRYITQAKLTRPQMLKMLHNIKTIQPGKIYSAGSGVKVNFTSRNFTVELLK